MARKPQPCRICGLPAQVGSSTPPEGPTHRACRVAQRKHGTVLMYDAGKCRCDECRAAKAADQRRLYHSYEARTGKRYGVQPGGRVGVATIRGTCETCGQVYFGHGARFCSRACLNARGEKREALWTARPAKTTDLVHVPRATAAPLNVLPSYSVTFVSSRCDECGTWFVTHGDLATAHCSTRCWKRMDDRARGYVPDNVRRFVYERDGWTCQLCGDPVDRDAAFPARLSATVDHIECVSWALLPDNSPANLRTAHAWCNSSRGNEGFTRRGRRRVGVRVA